MIFKIDIETEKIFNQLGITKIIIILYFYNIEIDSKFKEKIFKN